MEEDNRVEKNWEEVENEREQRQRQRNVLSATALLERNYQGWGEGVFGSKDMGVWEWG